MPKPGMQGERRRHGGRVWERELQFRPELLADGLTDKHLRRMRRSGELTTVRRGAYVRADGNGPGEPVDHLLRVRAAVRALSVSAVVSHVSAAALLGLPLWGMSMTRVHVIRARPTGGRREHRLHVHALSLPADEIATVDGLAITTPGRTLVDIGRTQPFDAAVAVTDAALHRGIVDVAELEAAVVRARGRPGVARARRVVGFADGRSESVGESRSRVILDRMRLPRPTPQWEVRSWRGRLLGRADFGWPELGTVGEFDGRGKYGRLLRPGETPGDAVFAEKLREDAFRDEGLRVVRWTWADLDNFAPVAERLRRAFGVGVGVGVGVE